MTMNNEQFKKDFPTLSKYGLCFKTIDEMKEDGTYDPNCITEIHNLFSTIEGINLLVDCFENICLGINSKDILIATSIFLKTVYKHSVIGIDSLEDVIEDFKLIFLEVNEKCIESVRYEKSE